MFQYAGSQWAQTQKLVPSDAAASAWFGNAVSIDGRTVIVGAEGDRGVAQVAGAAYVFEFQSGFWVETKLTASDATTGTEFGVSVDVRDELLVVGAKSDEYGDATGSAYVFRRSGGLWGEETKLMAPGRHRLEFGFSVGVDGDFVLASASREDSDQGAAYVFRHDGTRWIPFEKCQAINGGSGHRFSHALALRDGTMAIAAPVDGSGTVRVFVHEDLALEISPPVVRAGDSLLFETCGGLAGEAVILFLIDVNGVPFFFKVAQGSFGAEGGWVLHTTVPPGLAGLVTTLQSVGFVKSGELGLSTNRTLTFQ